MRISGKLEGVLISWGNCVIIKLMNDFKSPKIIYDKEADVLAVYMSRGNEEEYREIAPGIAVELDKRGQVIGIEILNAMKVLGKAMGKGKPNKFEMSTRSTRVYA